MEKETLESIKGPVVVVSLVIVIGLALIFGQGVTDAEKVVALFVMGLSATGYIAAHQSKSVITAMGNLSAPVTEVVTDIEGLTPEAKAVVATLQAGRLPSLDLLSAIQPELVELINDTKKVVAIGAEEAGKVLSEEKDEIQVT